MTVEIQILIIMVGIFFFFLVAGFPMMIPLILAPVVIMALYIPNLDPLTIVQQLFTGVQIYSLLALRWQNCFWPVLYPVLLCSLCLLIIVIFTHVGIILKHHIELLKYRLLHMPDQVIHILCRGIPVIHHKTAVEG